jgi:hypothetical protein
MSLCSSSIIGSIHVFTEIISNLNNNRPLLYYNKEICELETANIDNHSSFIRYSVAGLEKLWLSFINYRYRSHYLSSHSKSIFIWVKFGYLSKKLKVCSEVFRLESIYCLLYIRFYWLVELIIGVSVVLIDERVSCGWRRSDCFVWRKIGNRLW